MKSSLASRFYKFLPQSHHMVYAVLLEKDLVLQARPSDSEILISFLKTSEDRIMRKTGRIKPDEVIVLAILSFLPRILLMCQMLLSTPSPSRWYWIYFRFVSLIGNKLSEDKTIGRLLLLCQRSTRNTTGPRHVLRRAGASYDKSHTFCTSE